MVVPGAEWSAGVVHGAGKVVAVQVTTAQPATIKVSWPAGGPGMPPGAVTTHRQGMDAITKNVFAELEPADKQLSIKAVNVYVRPVNSLLRPSSITSTGGAGAQLRAPGLAMWRGAWRRGRPCYCSVSATGAVCASAVFAAYLPS